MDASSLLNVPVALALFSNALCNYILSHTGAVFESQYQTSRIRGDLMQAAFGQRTGSDNGPLFALLRNISLSCDQNAPVNLTLDDWAEFDGRNNATTLQEAMAEAREQGNQDFFKTLNSRLKYVHRSWKSLKLADKRRKYFEGADRSRAQGQQPPCDRGNISNHVAQVRSRKSNVQMANQIVQHFLCK